MSHESPLLLSYGFRRTPAQKAKQTPSKPLPGRDSPMPTAFNNHRTPSKNSGATLVVTGIEWTGKILKQDLVSNIEVDQPVPKALLEEWVKRCSWYHIVGSSATLSELEAKLATEKERLASLLREAAIEKVKLDISRTQTYIKRLHEGIRFCKTGFVRRPPTFHVDGRPLQVDKSLVDHGCPGPEHELECIPGRVGLGPCVYVRVTCVTSKRGRVLDEFQAVVPCIYKGCEQTDVELRDGYASMTMGDIARSLQGVFLSRNPGWQENARPALKYYGRLLDGEKKGDQVFMYHRGGFYEDKITLILDLAPYVEDLDPHGNAAKEVLSVLVGNVADAVANM